MQFGAGKQKEMKVLTGSKNALLIWSSGGTWGCASSLTLERVWAGRSVLSSYVWIFKNKIRGKTFKLIFIMSLRYCLLMCCALCGVTRMMCQLQRERLSRCQHPALGIHHVLAAGQGLLGLWNGLFLKVGELTLLHRGCRDVLKWQGGGGNGAVPFGDTRLSVKRCALIFIKK